MFSLPGYHIVGADVDSQELWIAALMGDSFFQGGSDVVIVDICISNYAVFIDKKNYYFLYLPYSKRFFMLPYTQFVYYDDQ